MLPGLGVSHWKLDPPELCGNGVPTLEWRGSIQPLILGGYRFPPAHHLWCLVLRVCQDGGSCLVAAEGMLTFAEHPWVQGVSWLGRKTLVVAMWPATFCFLPCQAGLGGCYTCHRKSGRPLLSQAKCVVAAQWGLLTALGGAERPWA